MKYLLAFLAGCLGFWAIGGFVLFDWDIFGWSMDGRMAIIISGAGVCGMKWVMEAGA